METFSVILEDYFTQLANSFPHPYNLFMLIITVLFIYLVKFYYTHNKDDIDKLISLHLKKITIVLISLTVFLVAVYFVTENLIIQPPPKDKFAVAISPFSALSPQGTLIDDTTTPNKIKKEIEKTTGNISVNILDKPPIDNSKDAIAKGRKAGAHLVIYGGTRGVVGGPGKTITEFNIILTNTSSSMLSFLDNNSGTGEKIISYSDKPIILESVEEDVSSAVYTIFAFEYYLESKYVYAVNMFKHVKNYQKEKTILFYIGNCYLLQNNFDEVYLNKILLNESLLYFDKAIEIDPNNSLAWNNKGFVLASLGKYGEAIKACDKVIEIDPNNLLAWNNKGAALDNLGRYNEAIKACDKVIEIDPKNSLAWNNKGLALAGLGKYDEAIKFYDKAIEIKPQYSNTWSNKGLALICLGKYDEAIKACDKAIEIDSNSSDAWNNKGYALICLGRYDDAIKSCDKAIEIDPNNSFAWNNKGFALICLGKYDEAIKSCDKAIEINQNYSLAWYNRARSYSLINSKDQAIYNLKKAVELDGSLKKEAKKEDDLKRLWTNEQFKEIVK